MKKYLDPLTHPIIPLILIALGTVARLLPHPANVAPIGAIALFGGLFLPKRASLIVPLLALLASDLLIGLYDWRIMIAVYLGFAISVLLGRYARARYSLRSVLGATLLGSVIFYLLTNFAVWAFGTMYPHTVSGLLESYTMALPFFRNSLLGDLFYVGLLVGSYELVSKQFRIAQISSVKM